MGDGPREKEREERREKREERREKRKKTYVQGVKDVSVTVVRDFETISHFIWYSIMSNVPCGYCRGDNPPSVGPVILHLYLERRV